MSPASPSSVCATPIYEPKTTVEALTPLLSPRENGWLQALELGMKELDPGCRLLLQVNAGRLLHADALEGDRRLRRHNFDFAIIDRDQRLMAAIEIADPDDTRSDDRWASLRPVLCRHGVLALRLDDRSTAEMLFDAILSLAEQPLSRSC
ncbi:DUF2726 domain-containing protein [Thioclava sp. SK-1]|uniref:DUF2726 domain-containing protein n=1 Tax=Thioclava sp. SK-1 TaxID=1889770 RepID=UPI00114D2831|nr:DUF2726 domain-containing protein [Thioclava sp. SK-1]